MAHCFQISCKHSPAWFIDHRIEDGLRAMVEHLLQCVIARSFSELFSCGHVDTILDRKFPIPDLQPNTMIAVLKPIFPPIQR